MFESRREAVHPGEIRLDDALPDLPDDAYELARFWVNTNRSYVAVKFKDVWAPELLGSLLVESVLTAARAYAAQIDISEDDALARMWSGFDDERRKLSNER